MIGKIILHYKILEKLGEGGMGVVFKAYDTTLNRNVALKFLPHYLTANSNEKERFYHEARAAASILHQNVCVIYEIGEYKDSSSAQGASAGKQLFIAMEYVDGKTLKKIIEQESESLSTKKVLDIALQVCAGLAAAHEKGIVHRDIKSENIMLTPKGQIKIMDFGLAKITGATKLTQDGSTLGTAAYMSPEQAQGLEIDNRSDIFSFGVVLYEMLTTHLPFSGEYQTAILYSLMNEDPQPVARYNNKVSKEFERIVFKALSKDREERYQHVDDMLADLRKELKELEYAESGYIKAATAQQSIKTKTGIIEEKGESIETSKINGRISKHEQPILNRSGTRKQTTEVSGEQNLVRSLIRNRVVQIGAGIFFIALVLFFVWLFTVPSLPKINPNRSFSDIQIPLKQFDYPALSPDGKMLAIPGSDINGNWDIYLMDIESGESRKLNIEKSSSINNASLFGASFSPDGSIISFGVINPKKRVQEVCDVSILGGFVRIIADTGIGMCWNSKGNRIYYFRGRHRAPSRSGWREYWSVPPDGGDAHLLFIDSLLHGAVNNEALSLSPDGKKAAFTRPFKGNYNEVIIRNLESGKETRLTHDHKTINDLTWLNNGYIIFNSNRGGNSNIWAISERGGVPKQITNEVYNDFGMSYSPAANRLVFQQSSDTRTLWKINTDGSENKQVFSNLNVWDATISPDGKKAALITYDPNSINRSLVIKDLKNGQQATLLPADSYKIWVKWSPSGRYLSYQEFGEGPAVSSAKIKILDLLKGDKPSDFGYGELLKWLSDSVVVIERITGHVQPDYKHLGGRGKMTREDSTEHRFFSYKLLNVKTGKERIFFRDSTTFAIPVLDNSKYLYLLKSTPDFYIVSKKELAENPEAKGKFVIDVRKGDFRDALYSNRWIYYPTRNAIWKIDLKTLRTSKIIDLQGENFLLSRWNYSDKFITYMRDETTTSIIKIDNLFLR